MKACVDSTIRDVYAEHCAQYVAGKADWNESFQQAWELDDSAEMVAVRRQDDLDRIGRAFEEEVATMTVKLVQSRFAAPVAGALSMVPQDAHGLHFLDGNVLYRVMKDVATARRFLQALQGILLGRTEGLTVPLSVLVVYRGIPVVAQALTDLLSNEPENVLEGELMEEMRLVAAKINVPLPECIRCLVYRGRDGRRYVSSTNTTTIPVDVSELEGPLQRREMLLSVDRPPTMVSTTLDNTLAVLQRHDFLLALRKLATAGMSSSVLDAQSALCATLHFYGVNIQFLPLVLDSGRPSHDAESETKEAWRQLKKTIGVELIARCIKKEFYLSAQAQRQECGDDAADAHRLLVAVTRVFQEEKNKPLPQNSVTRTTLETYVDTVLRCFTTTPAIVSELAGTLHYCRQHCKEEVMNRVCVLVGAESDGQSLCWVPLVKYTVVPVLLHPRVRCSHAALEEERVKHDRCKGISMDPLVVKHEQLREAVYWGPLRAQFHRWRDSEEEAMNIQRESIHLLKRLIEGKVTENGRASTHFVRSSHRDVGQNTSPHDVPSPLLYLRAILELSQTLFGTKKLSLVVEGYELLQEYLDGLKALPASGVTQARAHIRAGCLLLGVTSIIKDASREAYLHFAAAEKLIPSASSAVGAKLYIQSGLGLLRCSTANASSVFQSELKPLLERGMHFAGFVEPTDGFVEYLWELGMELSSARHQLYDESVKILTKALGMLKTLGASSRLDPNALTRDLITTYRAWDTEKYGEYCDQLEQLINSGAVRPRVSSTQGM